MRDPRTDRRRRVDLGVRETPIERWELDDASLLVKRDDLTTPTLGGNKARALELLLAGVDGGDVLLTVGSTGSTHALAVAHFGAQPGARTEVITWHWSSRTSSDASTRRHPIRSSCRWGAEEPLQDC